MMRFKVDENIHPDVAAHLTQQGHDVLTVWDEGLRGTPDRALAAVCQQEQRALLTLDLGFADIRVYPPEQYAGIIVLRLGSQGRVHVLQAVARLAMLLSRSESRVAGQLWIVDEQSLRVRGDDEA